MTQDNDDLLAQVFSVLPPMEQTTVEHHEINGNNIKEESKEYLSANVRRVSNAFQDFLEKSGVVETNFQSVTERHSESHFQTTHVETHHEVITSHHEEHHHEEQHIGHGATFESHIEHHTATIGSGAVVHDEKHHEIGNGVSLVAGEQLPPGHEHITMVSVEHGAEVSEDHYQIGSGAAVASEESYTIGHGAEVHEDYHIGNGAAFVTQETAIIGQGAQVSQEAFGIGHGAVPQESYQDHTPIQDDKESVISVRTGLSEATSVSVHSSVSQKSVQIYSEAPAKPPSSRHSVISQHSASTLKETVSHTHDKESTISLSSVHSENSTLTGTGTAVQSYVVVERSELIDAGSELSTPVAPLKSAPHDAVIQEFKQLHHREPSEVSVPPVPTSSPPPLDEEDSASEVIKTMRVTEFEFDSNHIKNTVLVEQNQHQHHSHEHHHHQHEENHHNVDQYEHKYQEPQVLHYEETHTHVPLGQGVQVQHNENHAIGEGVQLTGYHQHHESEDEFKFEQAEYVEQSHVAVEKSAHSVVSSVVAKSDPPPVFFQSPVLNRRVPSNVPSHVESDSDDDTITGSTHHHHHEHHEHHQHHEHHEHHEHHNHHEHQHGELRELIPNINRAHVRDLPRPAHVSQETRTVTVVKTVAPIAHVTPVEKVEVQHAPVTIDIAPVVQTHLHEHHGHHEHHHHHEEHEGEKHYHKHSEQLEEVFSGPSVRDLKSKFELGGKVEIHYNSHYISHHDQLAPEIEHVHLKHEHEHHAHEHSHEHAQHFEHVVEQHQHEHELSHHHEHDHHHHHHEQHSHHDHHHQDQRVVVQKHEVHDNETSVVPHLPHRESHKQVQEEVHVHQHEAEHKHHHHRHHHHHHHDKHHEHKHRHHRQHNHEHDHHDHHEHVEHVHQGVEAVQVQKHAEQHSVVEHHHHEHHDHHDAHHQHEEVAHSEHVHAEHAIEEEQLPVSLLLSKYGGGAKLRRPDHVEEIKIYSRTTSVVLQEHDAPVLHQVEPVKSRTVTQSSVTSATTRPSRSATACSVQSCKSGTTCQSGQRSHSSTLTQSQAADVHHAPYTPVSPNAPAAAARSSSSDHQSVRVVKSVRAFVSQWGQKDFQPPSSPVITVPRLSSPQKDKEFFPEPTSRKSTVVRHVEHATVQDHHDNHVVQKSERAQSVAYSERSVAKSVRSDVSARSVATSETTSVASTCDCCSVCGKSKTSRATSKASSKRSSVASEASTVTTTTYSVHKSPQEFVEPAPITNHVIIPEVHEEFVLTPLSERRAQFEQGINRGYSIRRNLHGELRPMVNVFTD